MILVVLGIVILIALIPIPVGIYSFLGMSFSSKQFTVIFYLLFCFCGSLAALLYIPNFTDDLSRYYQVMGLMQPLSHWIEYKSFSHMNIVMQYQGTNKLFNLIEYLVARTGKYSVLPFLNTFVCNLAIFFPVVDLRRNKKITQMYALMATISLLMLFNINFTSNTMRWAVAVALFAFTSYLYFQKINDVKFIWIFLIPLLFHIGIILAVILAMFVALTKKTNLLFMCLLLFAYLLFWVVVGSTSVESSGNGMFSQITGMANVYSADFLNRNLNGLIVLYLTRATGILLILAALAISLRKKEIPRNQFDRLMTLLSLFQTLLIGNSMIFNRYLLISSILALYIIAIHSGVLMSRSNQIAYFMVGISILFNIVITMTKLNGMKFTLSPFELITSNILKIFSNIPSF